jgi:hypothetical protein
MRLTFPSGLTSINFFLLTEDDDARRETNFAAIHGV